MLIAGQQNRTTEDRCFRKNRCVIHFGPRKQTNNAKSAANLKGVLTSPPLLSHSPQRVSIRQATFWSLATALFLSVSHLSADGAKDSEPGFQASTNVETHWSLQPIEWAQPPKVQNRKWKARNPIDN